MSSCHVCNFVNPQYACPVLKVAFCSKECQTKHWNEDLTVAARNEISKAGSCGRNIEYDNGIIISQYTTAESIQPTQNLRKPRTTLFKFDENS